MKIFLTGLILSVGSLAIAGTALAANTADVKNPQAAAQAVARRSPDDGARRSLGQYCRRQSQG